jgi:hypothetical protein
VANVRTPARLLTVFAVLAGLFLMHGLPGQSCAAGSGMSAPVVADHAMSSGIMSSGIMSFGTMTSGHGSVCEFTAPSRDPIPVLALVLLAVAVLVTALWRPLLVGGPDRRGPPVSGAELLTLECVSRT